jgi:hypothetical protein
LAVNLATDPRESELRRIREREEIEVRLSELAIMREALEMEVAENKREVRELLRPAMESGLSISTIALLCGLSRQSLHSYLKEDQEVADPPA